jgi:hypothetical protein
MFGNSKNSVDRLHPLGREEVGEPDERKKITANKKTAQETKSVTRLDQSWHPGWLGSLRQRTVQPGSPT